MWGVVNVATKPKLVLLKDAAVKKLVFLALVIVCVKVETCVRVPKRRETMIMMRKQKTNFYFQD